MLEKKCPILGHSTTINAIIQGFDVLSSGHETKHICFCHSIGVALVFIGMTTVLVGCDTAFFYFFAARDAAGRCGQMKELFDRTLVEES